MTELMFEKIIEEFSEMSGAPSEFLAQQLFSHCRVDDNAYGDPVHAGAVYKYFSEKVVPHKIEVFKAGKYLMDEVDIPFEYNKADFLTNLQMHDLTKFSANEAFGYAFYNFKTKQGKEAFEKAWHHHKMNNPHHPEYWLNPNKSGEIDPIPMPNEFILEMVVDWIGAGKTYGSSLEKWLPSNLGKFVFHKETRGKLRNLLRELGFEATYSGDHRLELLETTP